MPKVREGSFLSPSKQIQFFSFTVFNWFIDHIDYIICI